VRQAVIDNIQIQISDIHVSFREPSSSASVMHFTIDSLRLHPIAANGSSASSVPPSPASSRSRSNSATISVDALFGGTLASAAMAAAAAACLHADCAAHPWPDLRRELALLERVLCRQLVLNNVCVFVEESGDALSESIWNRLRRKPTAADPPPPDSASAAYANLHCLVRDVGLRATLTTSPSSIFFATLAIEQAVRMHVRDVDVKLVCLFANQVRYLLEQVSGGSDAAPTAAAAAAAKPSASRAPLAAEHVRELWESTNWIWGVAPQTPTSPRIAAPHAAPLPKRRDSASGALEASLNADDFAMMPKGDPFRGLFCEVDIGAIELLVTEHLEHADVVTRSVEVIQRDLARLTLERVRLRLAARTNDLHCHMSLGAPSLVSLIDVNSSGVPLFAPLATGAEHADWLHVAYTHATHQQPSLRIALKPASLIFAPLLFNRLARVASIIEPYTRAAAVTHEHKGDDTALPLGDVGDVIAPLTRDEAAEAARLVSRRLDASFHRVALNELSALTERVDGVAKKVRISVISPLVQIALAVDTATVGAARLVFECKEIRVANFTDPATLDVNDEVDDTILRLQATQVSAALRSRPLLLPTELEAFVRAPLADGGVRIDAEAAALRFSIDHATMRELEAIVSRAGLQWNNGVDATEHVWRAPTASRPSNVNAQRRRAPRVIANWRPLLTPHLRRRADTTYYRASVLAKSVVLALGAPDAPVAELRADGVCVTASGHARGGRDCTRFALSISEAAVVEMDGELEHVLLSASAVAQVASPPSARSQYATPAAPLDRTMYGTPLGRSFVAPPPMTASRFGLDSMRLDSPFRAAHSVMAPEFDDEHHSRAAALGAPFPFQAEQRFMSPDSSLLVGTPQRGAGAAPLAESTPTSALSAFRRAGGRMFGELRTPTLAVSFVEMRVPDAPSTLPSVKLALTLDGVRAIFCNRGFAAIERALAAPPSTVPRATQQARLESLTPAQIRWQYLTLRLLQRARDRLLHAAPPSEINEHRDDDSSDSSSRDRRRVATPVAQQPQSQSVVRFGDHASWCRLLAARVARSPPHWLKWSELSLFLEAVLNKLSISLRNCIVSTPQQSHMHEPRALVPRLDFVVPHAQMRSVTRSGRALGAMVLSGQLVDVRVVLAQPIDSTTGGDGDDAFDDDTEDALGDLPHFYRVCAGAVRAVTVLRKDRLAARLVSRLNWRRSTASKAQPSVDDNNNNHNNDDDDDDDDDDELGGDGGDEPVQKAPTAVALNTLDVFVGDFEFRMPIDDLRVFGAVVRSLGSRDEFAVAAPAPSAKRAVLQKYHFRVFSRHARAAVDCVGSTTSQVHAVDGVRSLALESRATSLVVALSANGDLSLALDFDALLCHCVIDDAAFMLSEHQFESGLTHAARGNVLRPLHESTRRIVGGPVHGDGERMPHLRFEVDVMTDGGPSRLRWLLRGHELRLQPRVSRTLRSMWRAVRGTTDEKTSSIFDDVDPQKTPSTGLDVTLRVEDSALLFHSRPVTCAVAADALSMQLQTERGATSLIQVAADNFSVAAIDDLYVDEMVSVRDLVFSMQLVDVAAADNDAAQLLDDDASNLAHFLATLTGCRENAVLELSSRLRRLSARVAPNVALSALAFGAASFVLTDAPTRSMTELGEKLLVDLQQPVAWLRVDVADAQWAASVSSRALASDIRIGAFDAHVVGAALARSAGVSAAQRRRRQRYAVVASLLALRALSVATVIGDANVLPLLTDDAIDSLRSTVMAFERHAQQRRVSLARDDDSESSASTSVSVAAAPVVAPSTPVTSSIAAATSSGSGSISRLSMPRVASEHASLARAASSHSLRVVVDLSLTIRIDSVVASLPLAESAFRSTSAALATAVAFRGVAPDPGSAVPPTTVAAAATAWRKSSLRQRVRLATWFECGAIKAQCVDVDGAKLSVELNASLLDSVLLLDDLEATWASIDEASLHSVHTRVSSVVSLALVAPHAPRARTASAAELTLSLDDERRLTFNAKFARQELGLTPGWQVSVSMLRLAVQLQARLASLTSGMGGGSSSGGGGDGKFEPPAMRTFRATIVLPDGFAVSCVRDEIEFARVRLGDTSVSLDGSRNRLHGTLETTAFELHCLSEFAPTPVIVQICDLLDDDDASGAAVVNDVVLAEVRAEASGAIGVRVRLAPDVLVHADFRLLDAMRRDFAPFVEALTSVRSAAAAAAANAGAPSWRVARIAVDDFTLRARATMMPLPSIVPSWIAALIGDSGEIAVSFGAIDCGDEAALLAHLKRAVWRQVPLQLLRNWWPLGMQVATLYDAAREPATDISDRFALWLMDAVSALGYSVERRRRRYIALAHGDGVRLARRGDERGAAAAASARCTDQAGWRAIPHARTAQCGGGRGGDRSALREWVARTAAAALAVRAVAPARPAAAVSGASGCVEHRRAAAGDAHGAPPVAGERRHAAARQNRRRHAPAAASRRGRGAAAGGRALGANAGELCRVARRRARAPHLPSRARACRKRCVAL
jgi:hypothetical protein